MKAEEKNVAFMFLLVVMQFVYLFGKQKQKWGGGGATGAEGQEGQVLVAYTRDSSKK